MTKCFENSSRLEIPRGHGQFSSPDKGKTAPLAAVPATSGAEPNEADLDIEEKVPSIYYVSKEVGGRGFQMLMFDDMMRSNADLSEKRIKGKTYLFSNAKKYIFRGIKVL